MKPVDGFVLKTIEGVPYLLPYGQNVADHKRGIQLNETGVFIWNALQTPRTEKELLGMLANHYHIMPDETDILSKDLHQFLNQLISHKILEPDTPITPSQESFVQYLCIGGLHIKICGPANVFSKEFTPFVVPKCSEEDLTVEVHFGTPPTGNPGTLLLRSKELFICERKNDYTLYFPKFEKINDTYLKKDGSRMELYCSPPISESFIFDLFHAIRYAFLYLAQKQGMFAIHSASILYKGKAWLFSGHSGMGKSTQANLWKELYQTPIINGDLNLVALTENGPVIYGIPWCGTSGISDTNTYPLGGIILLGRSTIDSCEELTANEKVLLVTQRLISPSWDEKMLLNNITFSTTLAKKISICRLSCTKNPSAAETLKKWIDIQN